jgi:hypothetical protein
MYSIANGFNIAAIVFATLYLITTQLMLPRVPLVVYIDLYFLYKYLVKLGTTKEKRLIVDIFSLCQLYKKREISKIR